MSRFTHIALVVGFFIFASAVFFHPYFTKNQVPLPLNLLVSYYNPWKNEGYATVPNKPIGFDIIRLFFPFRQYTTEQLKLGKLPLWNPYVFSGNTHLAMYQSAVLYPLTIVYFLLPAIDGWTILVMVQPIIAGIGMFLFLKSQKLSSQSSFLGSIFWAFSGWMIAWSEESLVIEHSILWLPYAAIGSFWIWQKQPVKGFAILVAALTLSVLAGFTQSTIYLVLFTCSWNIWLFFQHKKPYTLPILIVLSSFITAFLITAIQWLPALEAYFYSPRGVVDIKYVFEMYLLPLRHLVTLFAPDFWGNPGTYSYFLYDGFYHERVAYLGILPLLFCLYIFFYNKERSFLFWKIITLLTLILAFNTPIGWVPYHLKIPLLSVMQPTRILMVFAFSASVLAAFGYEQFMKSRQWKPMLLPIAILVGIAAISWLFVGFVKIIPVFCDKFPASGTALEDFCIGIQAYKTPEMLELYGRVTLRNLLLPSALLVAGAMTILFLYKRKFALFLSICGLSLFSSFYFAQKFLYFSDRTYTYPPSAAMTKLQELAGFDRVWSYGNGYILRNLFFPYRLYTPEGYDAVYPQWYGELLNAVSQKGIITSQVPRTDADLKSAPETDSLSDDPYRLRMMEILGVKFVLEGKFGNDKDVHMTQRRFPDNLFRNVWENDAWRIWEYQHSAPRVMVIPNVIVKKDKQEIADILFSDEFDPSQTVILEENPGIELIGNNTVHEAKITSYKPEEVTIETLTDTPALLVLSDTYFPGWKAFVNGTDLKIYRANYAFRAVEVPEGKSSVQFVYQPNSVRYGSTITFIGFILLGVGIIGLKKLKT